MSIAITGISAVPAALSFSIFPYAGGVGSQPAKANASADASGAAGFSATGTARLSNASKVQVPVAASAPSSTAAASSTSGTAVKSDTVTLSTAAKVRDLRSQGEGDTQIAATLNVPIKEVDSDLHAISNLTQILAAVTSGAISGSASSA